MLFAFSPQFMVEKANNLVLSVSDLKLSSGEFQFYLNPSHTKDRVDVHRKHTYLLG
jgi:hypothetical protein